MMEMFNITVSKTGSCKWFFWYRQNQKSVEMGQGKSPVKSFLDARQSTLQKLRFL